MPPPALVTRSKIDPVLIEDLILGCAFPEGEQGLNVARLVVLLAGLPQAPSVFDPFQRPAQAIARRDEVLRAMLGNGDITSSQYANAVAQRKLYLKAGRLYTRIREPYFFSYVREALQRQFRVDRQRGGRGASGKGLQQILRFSARRQLQDFDGAQLPDLRRREVPRGQRLNQPAGARLHLGARVRLQGLLQRR